MHRTAVIFAIALIIGGCAPDGSNTSTGAADWDAFNKYTDSLGTVALDTRDLPESPAGFDDKQLAIFAHEEAELLKRSIDSGVARQRPDDAVTYVTREQLPSSTQVLKTDLARAYGGNAWQWNVATLLPTEPTEPARIVKVTWDASTRDGTLGDGSAGKILDLSLQAHVVHATGTGQDRRTFLIRRTVLMSGFKPGGGPDFWPYLTVTASTWGNSGCELLREGTLKPIADRAELGADLAAAKVSIDELTLIRDEPPATQSVQEFADACRETK